MLSNIASLLLGSFSSAEGSNELPLTTRIVEDDWVCVDNQSDTQVAQHARTGSTEGCTEGRFISNDRPGAEQPSAGHVVGASDADGGWLVTPPACFATQSPEAMSPQRVLEPHPMENLLIEHPSMSVYGSSLSYRLPTLPAQSVSAAGGRVTAGEQQVQQQRRPTAPAPSAAPRRSVNGGGAAAARPSRLLLAAQKICHSYTRRTMRRSNQVAQRAGTLFGGVKRAIFQPR